MVSSLSPECMFVVFLAQFAQSRPQSLQRTLCCVMEAMEVQSPIMHLDSQGKR